jgi:polycystin 2
MTYVFFVFFVLLNMFLAIINDTYSEVKAEISMQKSEFEISDYIKRGYNKVLEKLSLKKDRIRDIQDAIVSADLNNDKRLDWEEWRLDLKMRGIPDAEIEAVFAKYDQDGDLILNEHEQKRLHDDLEKQRSDLTNEIEGMEKNGPESRPVSARSKGAISHVSQHDSAHDSDDEDCDDDDEDYSPPSKKYASRDEFQVLTRRVDRMEHSIGSIVSKIDAVIVKLEAMERAKVKRRENMGKLLDNITDDDKGNAEAGKQAMERLVREELERWDSDASVSTPGAGSAAQLNTLRPSSGRSVVSNISQARSVSSTRAKHSQGS